MIHARQFLRRLLLPIFRRINLGDITIRHPHSGDPFRLHSFRHKGYWFHGAHHEMAATIRLFRCLARRGGTCLDVGGHIGYTALALADCVGPQGRVFVFEPGPDNLRYLRRNCACRANIAVVAAAVSNRPGRQRFFVEDLTGQNNSLVADFTELRANAAGANIVPRVETIDVEGVTLDGFCRLHQLAPQLVKIDVEGAELQVLEGAAELLHCSRPVLIVEVRPELRAAVWKAMDEVNYLVLDSVGRPLPDADQAEEENLILMPAEQVVEIRKLLENY